MTLTKEQILSIKPKIKSIFVPEWDGPVFIRPITLKEQAKLADLGKETENLSSVMKIKKCTLELLSWTVVDENGDPLFSKENVDQLMEKGASAFLRLQDEVLKYSGLTESARSDIEKNLLKNQD